MTTPTVGNSLSQRAQGVLFAILVQQVHTGGDGIEGFPYPFCSNWDDLRGLTRRAVRLRLHRVIAGKPEPHRYTIRSLLLRTLNCGTLTTNEILMWLDLHADQAKPHVCVCRTCGRTMQ